MKKLGFIFLLFFSSSLFAQSKSDFEIIYKGACTFDDIAKVPSFDLFNKANAYIPDTASVAILKNKLSQYHVTIFLGTWCEDSQFLIQQLYRILKDAAYPINSIDMFAVDRNKEAKNDEAKEFSITNVPTIIVKKNNEEIGRITETVHVSVEKDLVAIIQKGN